MPRGIRSLTYMPAKRCKNGHLAPRRVTDGACVECVKGHLERRAKKYVWPIEIVPPLAIRDPEKVRLRANAKARRYAKRHPERVAECNRLRRKRKRAADPVYAKHVTAQTMNNRLARLEARAGRKKPEVCELCGEPHKKICFDHDPVTGKFRGWLCSRCNATLGHVKESPKLLRAMIRFLEKHSGKE